MCIFTCIFSSKVFITDFFTEIQTFKVVGKSSRDHRASCFDRSSTRYLCRYWYTLSLQRSRVRISPRLRKFHFCISVKFRHLDIGSRPCDVAFPLTQCITQTRGMARRLGFLGTYNLWEVGLAVKLWKQHLTSAQNNPEYLGGVRCHLPPHQHEIGETIDILNKMPNIKKASVGTKFL